jgi:hypothetical protein
VLLDIVDGGLSELPGSQHRAATGGAADGQAKHTIALTRGEAKRTLG